MEYKTKAKLFWWLYGKPIIHNLRYSKFFNECWNKEGLGH